MLGQLYASQNRLPEATAEFEALVQKQPKGVGAHTLLGVLLQLQNRRDEAKARYEKVLELNPSAGVAANNLAWMRAEDGDQLDVALQLAQTAKAAMPDSPEVSDTLGWVYFKKGLTSLAISSFKEAVEKNPNNAVYNLHLGLAYARNGDAVVARQTLERALTANPNVDGAAEARTVLANLPAAR
jgi:Flp pilus assembly protein TadD